MRQSCDVMAFMSRQVADDAVGIGIPDDEEGTSRVSAALRSKNDTVGYGYRKYILFSFIYEVYTSHHYST